MLYNLKKSGHDEFGFLFPEKRLPLHSMLINCGFMKNNPGDLYSWYGLQRGRVEYVIWQYTISGVGGLEYENKSYEIGPGQAMLLRIPQNHHYFLPEGKSWEFIYISMIGREVLRVWKEIESNTGCTAFFAEDSDTVNIASEIILKKKQGKIDSPFKASSLAYRMLMAIANDYCSSGVGKEPEHDSVRKVIKFCLKNLDKPLSVDDMAEVAGFSRFHFSRLFSASQGISPAAFLNELKMKYAVQLLQSENISIQEVGIRCGFQDPSYFCKVFRKYYHISPERFRKGK
jgi:AraC-like DNA-binding protein